MNSRRTVTTQSKGTPTTKANTVAAKSKRLSPYDAAFEMHLNDHHIYLSNHDYISEAPKPNNLGEIHDMLLAPRASLSPSRAPSAFRRFQQKGLRVSFEADVMGRVIPIICGDSNIHSQRDVLFTELEPITNERAVKPKPDWFDGSRFRDVHKSLRGNPEISSCFIPSKNSCVTVAPNLFLDARGLDGSPVVAQRQACYHGAYGARAMHALQNYGETESTYDENAYSYSSTYHDGNLRLYAHHMSRPTGINARPQYHMTRLGGFDMTDSQESFTQGATAFRNARDMAQRYRDQFIEHANVASQAITAAEFEDAVEPDDMEESIIVTAPVFYDNEALQGNNTEMIAYHDDTDVAKSSQLLSTETSLPSSPRTSLAPESTPSFTSSNKRSRSQVSPTGGQAYRKRLRWRASRQAEES